MTKTYQDRAKQFMPYAALRGYDELVEEEERIIYPRRELAEDECERLSALLSSLSVGERVKVTYYAVDTYFTATGEVLGLDPVLRTLTVGGRKIALSDLYGLERVE